MADVLSQKQIDRLAEKIKNSDFDKSNEDKQTPVKEHPNKEKDNIASKNVSVYDFRSPKKYTKDQLRIVDNIFDNVERLISLKLSGMLRVSCGGEVVSIEEMEYSNYSNAIGDLALIGMINITSYENEKLFLLEMDRSLSFCIIDRLLGGDGSCVNINREYTDIELSILTNLYNQLMPEFSNAWENYTTMTHKVDSIETNPRMIQSISQEETVVLVTMEYTIKELVGQMNVCIPAETMDTMIKAFESKFVKSLKKGDIEQQELRKSSIMNTLEQSSLVVTGMLGNTEIQLQELLNLQKGDIYLLNNTARDKKVTVEIEGVPWYKGSLGVYKKNYAIKLDEVINKSNVKGAG